jgi:hypothetical protein
VVAAVAVLVPAVVALALWISLVVNEAAACVWFVAGAATQATDAADDAGPSEHEPDGDVSGLGDPVVDQVLTPAEITAGLVQVKQLDSVEGAELKASVEPDVGSIRFALDSGVYADDPTREERIRKRLADLDYELNHPTVEDGVDLAHVGSLVASLARETELFHRDETTGPAAEALVRAVGDDPSDADVPTRILEEFDPASTGPLSIDPSDVDDTPDPEHRRSILTNQVDPTYTGPMVAARTLGWLPRPGEAADTFDIASGVSNLLKTTVGGAAVGAAAVPVGAIWGAGSAAIGHLLLVVLSFIWVRRNRDTP